MKTKKALVIILHILLYPVLVGAVLALNWHVIMTQTKNYGIFVFVGLIVTLVMTLIYYLCYLAITSKKKANKKSLFNQTVRLCMVVVFTMTGLWVVCDVALPDFLATATSSTIYYEELADGWNDRAQVNEDLLNTFIELSVKAGTLPAPYDEEAEEYWDEESTIAYYQSKGYNEVIKELNNDDYFGDEDQFGKKRYNTIAGLFAIQYQSINANGYQTFTHPWIDFATSDRLTIPCLVHLLLDKREIKQDAISDYEYTEYSEDEDGNLVVDTVFFVVYDKNEKVIVLKGVDWTVLDMIGTDTVVDLGGMVKGTSLEGLVFSAIGEGLVDVLNEDLFPIIASTVAEDELVGSDITVLAEMDTENKELAVVLRPSNAARGVLGYQEMAWLDSNGLIYAIVTLFSTRKAFLIFGIYGVIINLLIGFARGMGVEERETRKRVKGNFMSVQEKKTMIGPMYYYQRNVKE